MSILPTVFELPSGWTMPHSVLRILKQNGWNAETRGHGSTIHAMRQEDQWEIEDVGCISAGCRIERLASKSDRRICMSSQWWTDDKKSHLNPNQSDRVRRYLDKSGKFDSGKRIALMRQIMQMAIKHGCSLLKGSEINLRPQIAISFGPESKQYPVGEKPLPLLRKHGPLTAPTRHRIFLSSECWCRSDLENYSKYLANQLTKVHWNPEVRILDFEKLSCRLDEISAKEAPHDAVFGVGIEGGPGDPIATGTLALLDRLDDLRLPYRVFSDQSKVIDQTSNSWAVNDQAPHYLTLAGATTWEVQMPDCLKGVIFIGLDLGHPKRLEESVPVISLVSEGGRLLGWWRGVQPRDETLRTETLRIGFFWLAEQIRKLPIVPAGIVLLRDGRIFEREELKLFLEGLNLPSVLLEMPKSPAPYLLDGTRTAPMGTVYIQSENSEVFMQPPSFHSISSVSRFRVVKRNIKASNEDLAVALLNLCHAPILGIRPSRLPSPIYWSDGLARNGGMSPKFRGLAYLGSVQNP